MELLAAFSAGLLISGFFAFKFWRELETSKKQQENQKLTADATDLLAELCKGGAVAVVNVIDPNQIFVWSQKAKS